MKIKAALEHLIGHAKQILGDLQSKDGGTETVLSDLQAAIEKGLDAVSLFGTGVPNDIKAVEQGAEAIGELARAVSVAYQVIRSL